MSGHESANPMVTDVFVKGAVQGWNIATSSTIPNVLMAFVIIKILKVTGLLDMIGAACGPVMAIFGLPGEAIMVLLGGWLSMGGGVGVAVAVVDGLDKAARGQVVAARGDLYRRVVGHGAGSLHESLAVGALADDDGTVKVLQGAGEDFGRACGVAVDEHDQGQ